VKLPEPWLRGPIADVPAPLMPVLFSFIQAREDLEFHTAAFSTGQLWARPAGLGPVGFHIRHIGRSTDRLMTYLQEQQLSEAQLKALDAEMGPGESRAQLFDELNGHLAAAEAVVRRLDLSKLVEPRGVGRKKLPTTVIGLLTHIAEHTQRHVGQAICIAKIVRAL